MLSDDNAITQTRRRKAGLPAWVGVPTGEGLERIREWFQTLGYQPFPYQEEAWWAYRAGHSGLVHVPTGAGKTYSAYLGPLSELMEQPQEGLAILVITPMRALSRDLQLALEAPITAMDLPFRVESRTGDTSSSARARQKKQLPHVLVTTPESLNLLLTYPDARERFAGLKAVIVDEWHEFLASKRGVQVELALARLRRFAPALRTWALSATLANLAEAAQCVVGVGGSPVIVTGQVHRPITIDSLIPPQVGSLPWAGHLGSVMLQPLVEAIDITVSTLVFTNVRSHAERWYQAILDARPDWAGLIALHHGSMEKADRAFVEAGLKSGLLKLVVCTSSLDLGVDFAPVERVFQIGSPKGIARMIQRAGRSSHRPGEPCRITGVPTQALELAEVVAVRQAVAAGHVEPRLAPIKPYDVLVQHLVTCGLGGGFVPEALYEEVTQAVSYQDLSWEEFTWILQLVRDGGNTLSAYPDYHKLSQVDDQYEVINARVAQLHRFNIGTIASDASMTVAFQKGQKLGQVEESFIAKLKMGDVFTFAGRQVEFLRVSDMTATVRLSRKPSNVVPRWSGGRLPLSPSLADGLRHLLARQANENNDPDADAPEIRALQPVLALQRQRSCLPQPDELLIETLTTRMGHHLFVYPFEGRLVHEGLAALLAYRMSHFRKLTLQMTVNDYGIEFLSQEALPYADWLTPELCRTDQLTDDLLGSLNLSELARRQFRDVARVAGLVYQNYPGRHHSARQLQVSSGVLYDVFQQYDPENLLLEQARREVLEQQFEQSRLKATLARLQQARWRWVALEKPTPLGFPLMAERIASQQVRVSNETLAERVAKLQQQWLT